MQENHPPKFELSPSQLNLYNDCQRCLWLHHNKKWRRPSTPFPSLPGGMDRLFKAYYERHRAAKTVPPELKSEDVTLFEDATLLKEWQNPWRGLRWTDEHGHTLKGAVDAILRRTRQLIVADFKTRSGPPLPGTIEYYRLQLGVYALLLEKNGYVTGDCAYLIFYYPTDIQDGGIVKFACQVVEVRVDTNAALQTFRDAIHLLNGPIPIQGCGFCKEEYPWNH